MRKAKINNQSLYASQYQAAFKAVNGFFNSDHTSKIWMATKSTLLGNVSPENMLKAGRFDKLINFIYTQLDENKR